jgi:hypothetical protein
MKMGPNICGPKKALMKNSDVKTKDRSYFYGQNHEQYFFNQQCVVSKTKKEKKGVEVLMD